MKLQDSFSNGSYCLEDHSPIFRMDSLSNHRVDYDPVGDDTQTVKREKSQCSFSETDQAKQPKPKKKSSQAEIRQTQRLIMHRVYQKLRDKKNKRLFPELMGPHPIYATQSWEKSKLEDFKMVDLKEQLTILLKKYWWKRFPVLKVKKQTSPIKLEGEGEEQLSFQHKNKTRYNKYSLQFKKSLVKKIQEELARQGSNAKSLRHYIVKESQLLRIPPKNITRWLGSDLDRMEGGRIAKFPILEYQLEQFIKQNPKCRRSVIISEARRIMAQQLGCKQKFCFSKGWYQRFKTRMKQKKVTKTIERIIADQLQKSKVNNQVEQKGQIKIVWKDLNLNSQLQTNKEKVEGTCREEEEIRLSSSKI